MSPMKILMAAHKNYKYRYISNYQDHLVASCSAAVATEFLTSFISYLDLRSTSRNDMVGAASSVPT
jgi:hypothetical protein